MPRERRAQSGRDGDSVPGRRPLGWRAGRLDRELRREAGPGEEARGLWARTGAARWGVRPLCVGMREAGSDWLTRVAGLVQKEERMEGERGSRGGKGGGGHSGEALRVSGARC